MLQKPTYEALEKRLGEIEAALLESKQAGAALAQATDQLRMLCDRAPVYMAYVGAEDLCYKFVNHQFEIGFNRPRDAIVGKHIKEIIGEANYVFALPFIDKVKSGKSTFYENEFKLAKSSRWVRVNYTPDFDDHGRVVGIVVVTYDTTDAHLAISAKRLNEERLRGILDVTPFPIALIDAQDDEILYWSRSAGALFGHTAPTAAQWYEIAYPDPDYRCKMIDQWRSCVEEARRIGKAINAGEYRISCADGSVCTCEIYAAFYQEQLIVTFNDITDRKQVEEALRTSEEKYRTMMESMRDPSYICSLDYRIVYMNTAMADRIGRDATGETCYQAIHARNDQCPWCGFERVRRHAHVEYELADPLGQRYYSVSNSPIVHVGGDVSLLSVLHDITQLKTMEEELRQSQKLETIGTLTGGVAHDFNNILSIIMGNAELALDDITNCNPVYANLTEIKAASLRGTQIVKQLLGFSRKNHVHLQPLKIASIIDESLAFLRATIPSSVDIRHDIKITDDPILADPAQINQVLMNLCINAAQAMEETGGTLSVRAEKVNLGRHVAGAYPGLHSGPHVKVTIADTGPGIAPEIMGRIFEPYFTTKPIGKGAGMGLAVVHGIVKNHSGAISVDSRPGCGTTVTLYFPVAEEKPTTDSDIVEEPLRGSETILLVDDEPSIVQIVHNMLARLGYQVITAAAPEAALAQFQSEPARFDLVITDMTMPKMTGAVLSEALMKIRPDIPIIICTGHSALINEQKAKQMGIAAYVMKPIVQSEMAKTVRSVLDALPDR